MSAAASLGQHLAAAVQDGKIPHAVVCATNRDGSFQYSHAVGKASVDKTDTSDAKDIQEDAVFLLASQTKLLTAFAAMLVVERGLIGLDDDVSELLPELGEQKVLVGFEDDGKGGERAVLEERKGAITLRHLLTHTAGTAYDAADPNLIRYQSQQKQQQQQQQQQQSETNDSPFAGKGATVPSRFSYPLVFHPGSQWSYGSGLDWAGLLIERLTNSTLEAYMKTNIWDPLDLQTMTFFPENKGLQTRVPELSVRGPDGKLHPFREPFINAGMTSCAGGQGAYSSMADYAKFLRHLLVNDGSILSRESVDELFKSQLTPEQAASMKEYFAGPRGAFFIGEFDLERYEHGFSFGGIVFLQGYEDGRRTAGSVSWGGVANCFWVLDREAGVAVSFGMQVIQPGDKGVEGVIEVVEKGVYGMGGEGVGGEARL